MSFLVSSTESKVIFYYASPDGISSRIPEKYGSDFLIFFHSGRGGIQRKKFPEDFFASLDDGRLARELAQMAYLEYRLLVIEGTPHYTSEGNLLDEHYSRWTRQSIRNLLRSVKIQHGVDVEWSENEEDTVRTVREVEAYLKKEVHRSLLTRPKSGQINDAWGDFNRRDFARYFLQGLPSIGSQRAEAIFDTLGRIPLRWDCTEEELREVWGIGPKTASMLIGLFDGKKKEG